MQTPTFDAAKYGGVVCSFASFYNFSRCHDLILIISVLSIKEAFSGDSLDVNSTTRSLRVLCTKYNH